jgi:hypothetical protein
MFNHWLNTIIPFLFMTILLNFEDISSPGKKASKSRHRDASRRLRNTELDNLRQCFSPNAMLAKLTPGFSQRNISSRHPLSRDVCAGLLPLPPPSGPPLMGYSSAALPFICQSVLVSRKKWVFEKLKKRKISLYFSDILYTPKNIVIIIS